VIAPCGEQFEIAFGDQRAVAVEVGGGLRCYRVGGVEILDGYTIDEMCTSGRGQLLIPWPNRIEDGSCEFQDRRHQLALTEPEHGNAIQGVGRWTAWSAVEREANRVVLEHVLHPQPGYPFSLALRAEYFLSDGGLSVRTTATNVGSSPCPFGSGAHPYLTLGTETVDALVLQVPARTVLRADERVITGRRASGRRNRIRLPQREADRRDEARQRVYLLATTRRRPGPVSTCASRRGLSDSRCGSTRAIAT
jgi:aldose 1-epimerase